MPNLSFVLPHWMYWFGLVAFPLLAMYMFRKTANNPSTNNNANYGIAYFLLLTAGFIGMHRLYLRNLWGLLYIPLFVLLLYSNAAHRDIRIDVTNARTLIMKSEFMVTREEKNLSNGREGAQAKIEEHQKNLETGRSDKADAEAKQSFWDKTVVAVALVILAGLVIDALLMPLLLLRCHRLDESDPIHQSEIDIGSITAEGGDIEGEDNCFALLVGKTNQFAGTFVAYWSVIAVVVYYYEVIARYVFNSPTNWAHEGMFLMFGAQYLIAGGFCLRENAHVRVDVFYANFSKRTKAKVDIVTSMFFFIFLLSLLVSGWTFFMDSFSVREVSFTEWGIQYYPAKLSISLGALLLLLQGFARLLNDINTLRLSQ